MDAGSGKNGASRFASPKAEEAAAEVAELGKRKHKTHVLFCPSCNLTYKLLHWEESDAECDVCRQQAGAEDDRRVGQEIKDELDSTVSIANRTQQMRLHSPAPSEHRVYPPPPCSGATCPRDLLQQPPCPPQAPCDRGNAAKVCPAPRASKNVAESGARAIPVLHELTQQNPNHLEGPVFLAEKLCFFHHDVDEAYEPIEVACETTSIHWPLHFNETSQTEPIEVYPLCPVAEGCLTELVTLQPCFDNSMNLVSTEPILTMEECVSPTGELIEVARECTSVHRPPWTDNAVQTDPVRTVPIVTPSDCTEVVTGIDRERLDETHDRVIVHTDRVCYSRDRGCERLLSKDGDVVIRPPEEVARVSLPDKVLIEEHNPESSRGGSNTQLQQQRRLQQGGPNNLVGQDIGQERNPFYGRRGNNRDDKKASRSGSRMSTTSNSSSSSRRSSRSNRSSRMNTARRQL